MNLKKPSSVFLFLGMCGVCQAQSGTVATGGDVTSPTGSVSYSIGQVDFRNISGSENNLNQGLQQPYEFFIISSIDESDLELSLNVFPNPTRDAVMLKIQGQELSGLQFQLYDELGNLLITQKIMGQETMIQMSQYAMASYFLKVTQQNAEIKTFQIIKNF